MYPVIGEEDRKIYSFKNKEDAVLFKLKWSYNGN